ncbi:hypothetical protein K439DRAFT_1404748 [Ramaria rubella]|nr:hypothetical protein K439DRAFT_1404748 [Ramaria rubella]
MAIDIDTAELAGIVAEGGFYGVFLTLFLVGGYLFTIRKSSSGFTLNYPMAITAVAMLLVATAQLCVDTANVFYAFLHGDRAERLAFLLSVGNPLFTARHSLTISQLLIGDSFVTYRCWVVWGRSIYVVIIPILLSLGSATSGAYVLWVFAHVPSATLEQQKGFVSAIFLLSLSANALATSFLAFRIWGVHRRTKHHLTAKGSTLMPIFRIIIESGAMNAAYLFVYNLMVLIGSEALEFMASVASPISGIIFSIVIIRVGLNATGELDWTVDHRKPSVVDKPPVIGGANILPMETNAHRSTHGYSHIASTPGKSSGEKVI